MPAADDVEPDGAGRDHHQALQLRLGQTEQSVVVAAHELDQEPLGAGVDEVDREQDPGPEAVAQLPEQIGAEAHRQRLVDRRRVDLLSVGDGAVGIGHRPGPVPGLAVVAVAGELAAAAPDRVAERQRRSGDVEQHQPEESAVPGPDQDRDRAADRAAVPDQPRAGEEVAEQVVGDLAPVLDQVVEARADDAAGERGEGHLVGPVGGLAELDEAARDEAPAARKASANIRPKVCRVRGPMLISGYIRVAPAGIEPAFPVENLAC